MNDKKLTVNGATRAELFALPERKWNMESTYDSIMVLSTRKKHDSGWAMMAIIGVVDGVPTEIASYGCDDIGWAILPRAKNYGGDLFIGQIRSDCAIKSGAMHFWSSTARFQVGLSLSSTTITVRPRTA